MLHLKTVNSNVSCYITTCSCLGFLSRVDIIGKPERETHNYQKIQR